MALSYINNKEIKFGSAKPLNGVYTPGSPTREYEPLDSLGIYLNSGIPLSYGVENGRYMSMSDEFAATSQGNSYSFNQFFAAQMILGFKLHDRFIACDTEHKIIGTEPLLHKAYLAEITEKTLDYFKIKIYEDKTRTFCIRMSSSEVPTSYVDLTNSFDESGLNLTQTDRQSFLSYYRFYPLTARDPSSRAEETLGVDYYLLPSAEGLRELSGDILSKFNAFISSDGSTLTNLGNTAFAYAGDINYVPNYRGETSEAAVSAAESARVILGRVEEMHADINQILPEMKENLELTKQYRDEAMSTEIGTVRTDLEAEKNARIEADTALSTKIEVASSINRYEIENLKAKAEGQIYRTEIVDTEAYSLDVPSSVSPYAEVQKIGGKSVVWNQLCDYSGSSSTNNGITYTNNRNGSWTVNGTSTARSNKAINTRVYCKYKYGHKYYLSGCPKGGSDSTYGIGLVGYSSSEYTEFVINNCDFGNGVICTPTKEATTVCSIEIIGANIASISVTHNNRVFRPQIFDLTLMFGSGNEPTLEECKKIFSAEYYPYDAGTIKSFPVRTVRSVGKNLWNEQWEVGNYDGYGNKVENTDSIRSIGRIQVDPDTNYFFTYSSSGYFTLCWYDKDEVFIKRDYGYGGNRYLTSPQNARFMRFAVVSGYGNVYKNDIAIIKGTSGTYSPYREPVILDVSSVTSDLKSAIDVADEWENGKKTKRISSVDLGTLNWIRGGKGYYYANLPSVMARPVNVSTKGNMVSTLPIKSQSTFESVENGLAYFWTSSTESLSRLLFHNTTLADNVAIKAYLNGVMLYYELAEPTEETIPEIDNYIEVEGGGTLTFESDDAVHMPVPSTTRFVVDLTSTTEETT